MSRLPAGDAMTNFQAEFERTRALPQPKREAPVRSCDCPVCVAARLQGALDHD